WLFTGSSDDCAGGWRAWWWRTSVAANSDGARRSRNRSGHRFSVMKVLELLLIHLVEQPVRERLLARLRSWPPMLVDERGGPQAAIPVARVHGVVPSEMVAEDGLQLGRAPDPLRFEDSLAAEPHLRIAQDLAADVGRVVAVRRVVPGLLHRAGDVATGKKVLQEAPSLHRETGERLFNLRLHGRIHGPLRAVGHIHMARRHREGRSLDGGRVSSGRAHQAARRACGGASLYPSRVHPSRSLHRAEAVAESRRARNPRESETGLGVPPAGPRRGEARQGRAPPPTRAIPAAAAASPGRRRAAVSYAARAPAASPACSRTTPRPKFAS